MMTLVVFPSSSDESHLSADADDRIARLTDAVYRVALEQGITGSFVELQLGIWSAIDHHGRCAVSDGVQLGLSSSESRDPFARPGDLGLGS